jgi:dihydroorotate dehydrogenase
MGGITSAGDILEFMIAGARAVQVGSANIFDPFACFSLLKGLTGLVKECKIGDINEIVGSLLTQ